MRSPPAEGQRSDWNRYERARALHVRDGAQQSAEVAELFERRVHRLKGLPEDVLEAIEAAKMDASHDHLNALLEDECIVGFGSSTR